MPTCKKCHKKFPNRKKIDGKYRILQRRRYCLECSPFGEHNTKKIHKDDSNPEEKECSQCGRHYLYDRSKGHTKLFCNSCVAGNRRLARKKRMIEYKGGKCSRCGYDKSTRVLGFHHRDPSKKSFDMGRSYTTAWNKVQLELDKCDLLCANCHMEIEEENFITPCATQ